MPHSLIGARIRAQRRSLGITQAGLAATIGISASYLNLIERNRRNIGGALLKRVAGALGMALDELDGAAGRRLLDDLGDLTGDSRLTALQLDPESIDDLAGRHPGWARALVVLQRALLDRDRAVAALSDRLSHDPFLGDAVHNVLSRVAAIRSSSEILETVEDLEPAQRQRFVSIVGAESARLSDLVSAPHLFWSLGPALAATLFDGGARGAAVESARAALDLASAGYRQSVLTALQEVEDNLVAATSLAQEQQVQTEAVAAAQRALDVVNNQYRAGTVAYLNVLSAQTTVLAARRSLIDVQGRRLVAVNTLLKNVAGRWESAESYQKQ